MPEKQSNIPEAGEKNENNSIRGLSINPEKRAEEIKEVHNKELLEKLNNGEYTPEQIFEKNKDLFDFMHENYLSDHINNDGVLLFKKTIEEHFESQGAIILGDFNLTTTYSNSGVRKFKLVFDGIGKIKHEGQIFDAKKQDISVYFGDSDENLDGNHKIHPEEQEKRKNLEKILEKKGILLMGETHDGKEITLSHTGDNISNPEEFKIHIDGKEIAVNNIMRSRGSGVFYHTKLGVLKMPQLGTKVEWNDKKVKRSYNN